jgi:hypothetical protein
MTLNPLFKLREWLTVDQAAQQLTGIMEEPVKEADVLRLALDGHLKLSVYLPEGTAADCWDAPQEEDRAVDYDVHMTPVDGTPPNCFISGLWDLPLVLPGSLHVERRYNELSGLPPIRINGKAGAFVERPAVYVDEYGEIGLREGSHCRVRPMPESVLPTESVIVVRTAVIEEFASTLLNPTPTALDKPLGKRERGTLLVIIAALAKKASINLSLSSAAGDIVKLTEALGAPVGHTTVKKQLDLIDEAVEKHLKDYVKDS